MIAFEYTMDEIMLETHSDLNDVRSIVSNLYTKLNASTYVGLIRAAYEQGVLKLC